LAKPVLLALERGRRSVDEQRAPTPSPRNVTPIVVAGIGCAGTIVAALIPRLFGLATYWLNESKRPVNSVPSAPALSAPASPLTVTIDGPARMTLGERSYFTIANSHATRLVWSISGYEFDGDNQVEPVSPLHQIWIEPTDTGRIGDTFTIRATVYDAAGQAVTAEKDVILVGK
jgi:hypothetical protein